MSNQQLAGSTAIVTGASRGFGRATATALVKAGVEVVGVSRDGAALEELRAELGDGFVPVVAGVTDQALVDRLIYTYRPRTLVLNAGATPVMAPIQEQTWDSFQGNWEVDVQQTFRWVRAALLLPLESGSTVISLSSGAVVNGSPLSGGYAGAKATVRYISAYAAEESARQALGIRFVSVLPRLTPETGLGAGAVRAYADRQGVDVPTFLDAFGPTLSPESVGATLLELAADDGLRHPGYLLGPQGLKQL
ncbi:NADP-dependent 3-hydroxy acid dehydrogenase YdfG [Kitasatospora gansuensis]|uniref:NADP-dependent 3-hydroxy acid dehydrogenase YdfG n=1 Tax=Kitasatospora gansuensis TaxID=258050 RepID=A0A7W7SKB9_9ACTN|nr:SDR family oxidoreductase [Kitasatospora gansuensis]MBB4951473.1 NADP-dependent 3-hydroxy acid dehydrogenase YdfG [Kitasatospora gansuensis]